LTNTEPFLRALTSYYPKRNFVFEGSEEEGKTYGYIAFLLKDIEKNVLYCLNDLIDLAFKEEERKGKLDLIVPDSIKKQTARAGMIYHKEMPDAFEDFPKELIVTWDVEEKQSQPSKYPPFNFYNSPDTIFVDMLSKLKEHAIDFAELRLYDYLVQPGQEELHSTALLEIIDDMDYSGQAHYVKPVHGVKIKSSLPKDCEDEEKKKISVAAEELGSNMRRAHDLRWKLARRLVKYLNTEPESEGHQIVYDGYMRGNYPQLCSLIDLYYKSTNESVPKKLRVDGIEYY